MREARFIKKNVDKWNDFQKSETKDPDEIARRFITLLDDLSFSKSFYPHSKVTRWINGIAASIYQSIYKNRKHSIHDITRFWKYDLPLLFGRYHKVLLFTFCFFLLALSVSVISCYVEPGYAKSYFDTQVQRGYYDQTIENIRNGDPFNVYKDDNPFSMFIRIAYNNIRVAFTTVIAGIAAGAGTFFIMWKNSMMLGVFHYIFFSQGLGWQSVLVIWIHGTLEISSLIIASCAGFILGAGILFPGTYSRKQSFLKSVKDAIRICVALIPIFFVAAFFESYVTHLMSDTFKTSEPSVGLPVPVSILILAGSLFFILWYFVWYPIRLRQKGYQLKDGHIIKSGKKCF